MLVLVRCGCGAVAPGDPAPAVARRVCGGEEEELPSLRGKLVVITGANSGVGAETARGVARRGGAVVLACRSTYRAVEVMEGIRREVGEGVELHCTPLDLASLASVRACAESLLAAHPAIHALVCNAGVWVPGEGGRTEEGLEVHVGVNHLGHHLLASLLSERLAESSGRMVVVSSSLLLCADLDFTKHDHWVAGRRVDGLGELAPPPAYSDSKLMGALAAREAAVRWRGVACLAVSPGWCRTPLARHVRAPWYKRALLAPLALFVMRSAGRGVGCGGGGRGVGGVL